MLWLAGIRAKERSKNNLGVVARTHSAVREAEPSVTPQELRTKVGNRNPDRPSATHGPHRLKDFMLPEVVIDGLSLEDALAKLMNAYRDACSRSEETSLDLKFIVPPGSSKVLQLHLRGKSFSGSVRMLAALSGMSVSRNGLTYHFKAMNAERKEVQRSFQVPPDFSKTVAEMAGQPVTDELAAAAPLHDLLRKLGLDLDPSTRLSPGSSGELNLKTDSAADAAALAGLIGAIQTQPNLQHKVTTKFVELPSESNWKAPDTSRMSDTELAIVIRELSQTEGADLMTAPSVTAKARQRATIEVIREMIVPKPSGEGFETHDVGKVMQVETGPLGFGHDVGYDFSDTVAETDPANERPTIKKRTDIKDGGFSSDNGARFIVQTREDGSRSIVFVTTQLTDPTGRPISDSK